MTTGRKPVPTHLKLLRGTLRKHRQPNAEPKPSGDLLRCPDWFGASARQGWAYAIANSAPGLLKRCDRAVLATFVLAEAEVREATVKIEETGLVLGSKRHGVTTNPYVRVRRLAMLVMLRAAAELGSTPASRSRIDLEPGAAPDDGWDEILGEQD